MLRQCGAVFARTKRPVAVVRINWSTIYCFKFGYNQAPRSYAYDPADALREGMDVALVSLTLQTGSEERDARNVEVFARLTAACHALGIPVIGEYFPAAHNRLDAQQLHDNVLIGSRVAAELGADAIKTFYTKNFRQVTSTCPVPVLGLGAERLPTQEAALRLAAREVQDGAGGIVFGRNAIQVPDPALFQAALCDIVKNNIPVDEVLRRYALG